MARENILDKITKLLELAKSPNQHEAETAAQRAAELMTKHAVEEAELHGRDSSKIIIVQGRIDNLPNAPHRRVINGWMGVLGNVLAIAANGKCYTLNYRDGKALMMLGTQASVDATRYIYMWLEKQLLRNCRAHLAKIGGRGPEGNAYLHGACVGIHTAMAVGTKMALEGDPGTAMVHIDKTKQAVEDKLNNMEGMTNRQRKVSGLDQAAARAESSFEAGFADGNKIQTTASGPGLTSGKKHLPE